MHGTATFDGIGLVDSRIRTRRKQYDLLRTQMHTERSSFETHWTELGEFIMPRGTRFFVDDGNRGDRRSRQIIDSTATLATRTLAAGMMGGITSPARAWFRLATDEEGLSENEDVKIWLAAVAQAMRTMFLRSNLYNALPIFYKHMGVFGTAVMFIEEDFDVTMRAFPMPLGSYYLANDEKLRVRVFLREFRMTVRQMVEKFGRMKDGEIDWTNFSTRVKQLWDQGLKEIWIEVCHIVLPNEDHDRTKPESRFKKFISVYFETGRGEKSAMAISFTADKFLRERGYDVFPVLAGRWETSGEDVYGTDCPGMTALGDIKQLQLGEKRLMQAIEKMVNPPMKGPSHLRSLKTSILPGDITYSDEREGQGGFRPVHEVDPRIQEMEGKQDQVRSRTRRSFYEDLFLMLSTSDRREITATEVAERHEEKLLALGSVLENLNQDVLDPLIDIAFDFMLRQGLLPEPPEELQGMALKVEYISIMAQAQKLTGLSSIERLTGFVVQLSQIDPTAIDKLDTDRVIDEYADVIGAPPDLVLSPEDVARIREARAQAAAAQAQMEMAAQGAKVAQDLSKADLSGDNALKRLSDQAAAGAVTPEGAV